MDGWEGCGGGGGKCIRGVWCRVLELRVGGGANTAVCIVCAGWMVTTFCGPVTVCDSRRARVASVMSMWMGLSEFVQVGRRTWMCSANEISAATSDLGAYMYNREPVVSVATLVIGEETILPSIDIRPCLSNVAIDRVFGREGSVDSIRVRVGIVVNGSSLPRFWKEIMVVDSRAEN